MSLTGVVLDVSGSMRASFERRDGVSGGPWAACIFRVTDDLIKNDLSEDHHIFTIAFGCAEVQLMDILSEIEGVDLNGSKLLSTMLLPITKKIGF